MYSYIVHPVIAFLTLIQKAIQPIQIIGYGRSTQTKSRLHHLRPLPDRFFYRCIGLFRSVRLIISQKMGYIRFRVDLSKSGPSPILLNRNKLRIIQRLPVGTPRIIPSRCRQIYLIVTSRTGRTPSLLGYPFPSETTDIGNLAIQFVRKNRNINILIVGNEHTAVSLSVGFIGQCRHISSFQFERPDGIIKRLQILIAGIYEIRTVLPRIIFARENLQRFIVLIMRYDDSTMEKNIHPTIFTRLQDFSRHLYHGSIFLYNLRRAYIVEEEPCILRNQID